MSQQRDNYTSAKVRSFVPDITFSLGDGQSIDLLLYDQASQSFQINSEAMEMLLQYAGNIGFIINMGQKGVGKSFLLNQAMDLNPGYGSFRERERGIKIWTRPLYRDEEYVYLFFIDIEGTENDWNFKNFVWTLSYLLGTVVIYSTQGPIDERTFEDLSSLVFVAQNIFLAEDPTENEYLLSYYAPKLIWLLKDFEEFDTNGKQSSADAYLESALRDITREYGDAQTINFIKNFIINSFKDRTCINFPPIQGAVRFTDQLSQMPAGYIESVRLLKERIYSKALNKYFDGITLNAKMVVHFIACIVELYNQKAPIVYSTM
jgi:hypothetical protein